jgi:hypothetical protein
LFGLIVLWHLALLWPDLTYWLSDAGLLRGQDAIEMGGPFRPSVLQWIQDPTSVHVFCGCTAFVAVLFTLGWRTPIMGILLYFGLLSIHHRNIGSDSGADAMLVVTSFYLMLSPCGAAYSLDARREARRRGTLAEPLIVPWSQRLIQLQLSLIYFLSAFFKCGGKAWMDGTALHWILTNPESRRFTFGLPQYPLVINALTYGALLTEFCLAFLLWSRAARPWILLGGLGLHLGIMLTVNIPVFGELMTACYLTFLTPSEFDRFVQALNPAKWIRWRLRKPARIAGRVDQAAVLQGPHQGRTLGAHSEEPEFAFASPSDG